MRNNKKKKQIQKIVISQEASDRNRDPRMPEKDGLIEAKKKLSIRSLYIVLMGRQLFLAREESSSLWNSCSPVELMLSFKLFLFLSFSILSSFTAPANTKKIVNGVRKKKESDTKTQSYPHRTR